MAQLKALYKFLDAFFLGICGLTWIDIISVGGFSLDGLDNVIKTVAAITGAIYFIIMIPHKFKMAKLDRRMREIDKDMKEEELKKVRKQNEHN